MNCSASPCNWYQPLNYMDAPACRNCIHCAPKEICTISGIKVVADASVGDFDDRRSE